MRFTLAVIFVFIGWLAPLEAAGKPVVSVMASASRTNDSGGNPTLVTFTREGDTTDKLELVLEISGTAKSGKDFVEIPKTVVIPPGEKSIPVAIQPIDNFEVKPASSVVIALKANHRYQIGQPSSATVEIVFAAPALFVATLRPTDDAPESTAYGTATLQLSPEHTRARVTVSYANLTSPLVISHLKLAESGREGAYLKSLPPGQSVTFEWELQPTGEFTVEALQRALDRGRIIVAIDTKNHLTGELQGNFIHGTGSQLFHSPPAPPRMIAAPLSRQEVARFLTQTTFGPSETEINDFLHPPTPPGKTKLLPPKNFSGWIDEQMAIPASSQLEAMRTDFRLYPPMEKKQKLSNANRQNAWWLIALTAPDQLRQRVALALSEIFVVSDKNDVLAGNPDATASYYDLLARDCFGNFRQLLEDVTLSPAMGAYLSHLRSAKGDAKRGTSADENYAREVMQLFTIGLNELQPDGTLKLSRDGLPMPTYDQDTIVETAKIFTGWGFYSPLPNPDFHRARANYFQPMMLYPEQHDDGPKVILGGVKIPAKQGGLADLRQTLDTLFNHPNTGPFICRQLIQRLVTSNPSPGYVYRVSQVFAKNGHGERGDLGAVIRAILLDYEARSPDVLHNMGFGKMKEPLLQATSLLRAFDGASSSGRYHFPNAEGTLGQAPLRSPTVFNFFEPDYVLPGPLAAAGLHAPEYQIFTDTTAITIPNQLRNFIYTSPRPAENALVLKLEPLVALVKTPDALLDYLDLVFCSGQLSAHNRMIVLAALEKLPANTSDLERARCALDLVVTSADAAIQR